MNGMVHVHSINTCTAEFHGDSPFLSHNDACAEQKSKFKKKKMAVSSRTVKRDCNLFQVDTRLYNMRKTNSSLKLRAFHAGIFMATVSDR